MSSAKCSLIFLCLISGLLAFTSCGKSTQTNSQGDALDRIRRTGQVDVCTVVYPPWTMKDAKSGALSGYNIEVMNLIAKKMNAKVVWHESTFGNITSDLASGRCDATTSLFMLIPRAMSVAFTLPPLHYLGESAIIRKSDSRFQKVKDIYEFDKPDITLAVATGESGDVYVKEHFKRAKIKRIDVESSDLTRFCVEVSTGRADVAIADANTIHLYAKKHPEVLDLFRNNPFSLNPDGLAVRQNDVKWLHFLETALQFLDTQGSLEKLRKKYKVHCLVLKKQYKLQ